MSATNRPRARRPATERHEHDFYATPPQCVRRLLEHVELPGGHWLEPSAGDGAIIRAVGSVRDDVVWWADELRHEALPALRELEDVAHLRQCDFLRVGHHETSFDVALGNPPFLLAAEFIAKALECAEQVVFLLRLNFLGSSNKRRTLFERYGVPDIYVLPERPSFTDGGTDACEYAWMRWRRNRKQRAEVRILFEGGQAQTSAPGRWR